MAKNRELICYYKTVLFHFDIFNYLLGLFFFLFEVVFTSSNVKLFSCYVSLEVYLPRIGVITLVIKDANLSFIVVFCSHICCLSDEVKIVTIFVIVKF